MTHADTATAPTNPAGDDSIDRGTPGHGRRANSRVAAIRRIATARSAIQAA